MEAVINLSMNKKNKTSLLGKTSRALLIISAILMLISIFILYFFTKKIMENEAEENLYNRSFMLENYISEKEKMIELPPIFEVKKVSGPGKEIIKDTLIYDPSQKEMESFRELTRYRELKGDYYKITVRSIIVETEDIILLISVSFCIILFVVFLVQIYFSRAWYKKLWQPFFTNLNMIKGFSLKSNREIQLVDSDILEFSELKGQIEELMHKVNSDYQNLKQFTENVSHELQTPLAIMQAKIENILNGPGIDNARFNQLTSLQKDIQRLSQLNKKMVLLTKLENRQFGHLQKININTLIKESVENFGELTQMPIQIEEKNNLIVEGEPELVQIMLNNLITNAIRYNLKNGEIKFIISRSSIEISNPGEHALKNEENLFKRFYKGQHKNQGTGLGLAIVKKICDYYDYQLEYNYINNHHSFLVRFNQPST